MRSRHGVMWRETDRWGQWRMRKGDGEMGIREKEGKKQRRQDPNSSWAQQGASKKEFQERGTYYPELEVEGNCKQTLPTPFK